VALDHVPIWTPAPERIARANMTRFLAHVRSAQPRGAGQVWDVASLYNWSVWHPEAFWPELWQFCGVVADDREGRGPWDDVVIGLDRMAPPAPAVGPRWFPGARLNYAENLLRHAGDGDAIVFWNEHGRGRRLSWDQLRGEVAAAAAASAALGVGTGGRVAGFLPNLPETIVAMLAAASLGATWSSCSPDFGVQGVLDRFGQIRPKVLVCADGYYYAGKTIDSLERMRDVRAQLHGVAHLIVVPYVSPEPDLGALPGALRWDSLLEQHRSAAQPVYARLPFDHPLYIMYSSGTTGLPKCMVHGAGGTLLQHLKELALHTDVGAGDRVFYFTTCGWMMWNWMVSALATGATLVLFDGAPLAPPEILWRMAAEERITAFGTSAKYLALAEKEGLAPARSHNLDALRTILSTGSPLAAHSYDYVYREIKRDVHLASISGGTDIISCFALGNPVGPVWRGELQMRGLGMAVDVYDPAGQPLTDAEGELVCERPFPSMPVSFWDDPDGSRYRSAYFDVYPGVWRHGDWARRTPHDGLVILGRSDATLNPGGVRIGTAEIYRQVEQLDEVVESLVVGQDWDGDVRIVLFVRLREGLSLDEDLSERIRRRIREHATPHHVPRKILQVADIPRTISGKITELAVRDVIHGRAVTNVDALANPGALDLYRDLPSLRT
jgi:acetoacetyl-CoA synthetase